MCVGGGVDGGRLARSVLQFAAMSLLRAIDPAKKVAAKESVGSLWRLVELALQATPLQIASSASGPSPCSPPAHSLRVCCHAPPHSIMHQQARAKCLRKPATSADMRRNQNTDNKDIQPLIPKQDLTKIFNT